MKSTINTYVKDAAGENEINKALSAEENKYIKIYKSNNESIEKKVPWNFRAKLLSARFNEKTKRFIPLC